MANQTSKMETTIIGGTRTLLFLILCYLIGISFFLESQLVQEKDVRIKKKKEGKNDGRQNEDSNHQRYFEVS